MGVVKLFSRPLDPREYVDAYLRHCQLERKSPRTLANYGIVLDAWAESGLEPGDWLASLTLAPSTLNWKRTVLSSYWVWLVAQGYAERNEIAKLPVAFEEEKEYRVLTIKEVVKLIDGCANIGAHRDGSPITNLHPDMLPREGYAARAASMTAMCVTTGLRLAELCTIELARVNQEKRQVKVKGKGRKWRTVEYGRAAASLLPAWLEYRLDRGAYLYNTHWGNAVDRREYQRHLAEAADWAGVGHVTPHMLRHTFASTTIDAGVSVYHVKEMLGHSSIKTTERYIHADPDKVYSEIDKSPLSGDLDA